MICNYGNQSQEIIFPAKSLCSEEFGGVLVSTMYTTSDYYIMFLGCMVIFFGIVFLVFANCEVNDE